MKGILELIAQFLLASVVIPYGMLRDLTDTRDSGLEKWTLMGFVMVLVVIDAHIIAALISQAWVLAVTAAILHILVFAIFIFESMCLCIEMIDEYDEQLRRDEMLDYGYLA